ARLWHAVGRANILKYDGEAFWTAMQASLEATSDPTISANVYADLAFQTVLRGGMWIRRPDPGLVKSWTQRTLEVAGPGSPARAKALLAHAFADPEAADDSAQEALRIADQLDDVELRSFAFNALDGAAFARGDYEGCLAWCRRR